MRHIDFVHLRVHSCYSLLSSILRVEDIISLCLQNSMPAIALTDTNNLFGGLEFSIKAQKSGVQPIHGVVINVDFGFQNVLPELLLLAKSEEGFKNLLCLLTKLYLTCKNSLRGKRFITVDQLFQHKDGLIVLSGYANGPIGQALLRDDYALAKAHATKLMYAFKDNFYFEITRQNRNEENKIESTYLRLANEVVAPLVATCEIAFATDDQYSYFETFLKISDVEKDAAAFKGAYFKSQVELKKLFQDIPFALTNSVNIAKRCSFFAKTAAPSFPRFAPEGVNEADLLRKISTEGLNSRLIAKKQSIANEESQETVQKKYFDRLDYELQVICKMNFSGYFLIVHDFVSWSKANNITVGPGRGSGAGSIVSWSLGITDLDPVKLGLLFERFLNPERVSMPDFDIDFCQERREEVINYVRQKYGNNRVAHIITFGSLQAKAAIKDVARVLGVPFDISNFLTTLIPFNPVNPVTLNQAVNKVEQLNALLNKTSDLPEQILTQLDDKEEIHELVALTLRTALLIEGLPRHVSMHAAGIIIAKDDLVNTLPLFKLENEDHILTQYDMKHAELAGLLKFDFLGLQALTMMSKCVHMLKKDNIVVNFDEDNFDNQKAYQILKEGKNQGIFQFEGSGIKDCMQQLSPDNLGDLMALTSLYRPGPIENISTYVACKFQKENPSYLYPSLESILKDTYGIIIYQEQVMQIATELAGYTLGQADILRRAMGKKIISEMKRQESIFVEGAKKNGISEGKASEIFSAIAKFAGYGFNKSHAAAYSVISYQTAYLKANYPVYFFVSILNLELNDIHKLYLLIQEAKDFNITVVPPDINNSATYFTKSGNDSIIFALAAIKNIGVGLANEIEEVRGKNGKYTSIFDFVVRLFGKLTKKSLVSLACAGALDSIYPNRQEIFNNIHKILAYGELVTREKNSTQMSLFGNAKQDKPTLEKCKDWSLIKKAELEHGATGNFWTIHPLSLYSDFLSVKQGISTVEDLKKKRVPSDMQVKIAGFVHKKDVRSSGKGNFITLSLSDASTNFEATIFKNEVWKEFNAIAATNTVVVLSCEAIYSGYNFRFSINKIEKVTDFLKNNPSTITIYIYDSKLLLKIIDLLPKLDNIYGNFFVNFMLKVKDNFYAKILANTKVFLDIESCQEIKALVKDCNLKLENCINHFYESE